MNEIERVITIFRKKRSAEMDKLQEGLLDYGVDPDCIQRIINKEAPDIVTFFRVHNLPTVLLFSDGEEVKRLVGKEIEVSTVLEFLND